MAQRKATKPNSTTGDPIEGVDEPSDRFLTSRDLCRSRQNPHSILPWERTTLWRKVREGTFPRPIALSPGTKGWWLSTIRKWTAERERHPAEPRAYFGR